MNVFQNTWSHLNKFEILIHSNIDTDENVHFPVLCLCYDMIVVQVYVVMEQESEIYA